MNFRQLEYFLAIAHYGSQTEASRQLNVSQPALGVQLRALEEELGLSLFTRRSRGMELTEAGRHLLVQAEDIFERLAHMKSSMQTFRTENIRKMTLGAPPTPAKLLVPGLLDACARFGSLTLSIREGLSADLVAQLDGGRLDLALCYDPPAMKGVHNTPLFQEELILIGPKSLLADNGGEIAFKALERVPLILDSISQITRTLIDNLAKAHDVRLNVIMELESVNLKRDFLITHGACSIVPYGLFLDSISNGQFNWARISTPSITRTLCLLSSRHISGEERAALLELLFPVLRQKIEREDLHWRRVPGSGSP